MKVCVSGGFDPIHPGHIRYILEAARYGDVTIILNSDDWLMRKKGYVFQSYSDRSEILRAIRGVHDVVPVNDADNTVCDALRSIRPDYFAKGGDRTAENTPEVELCGHLGIELLWNIGGGKIAASSQLVERFRRDVPKAILKDGM